jgi:hypothetical protein
MAIKDVKQYYYMIQAQYLEMKADLEDFEKALQEGFITEDKLEAVKDEVYKIETNYNRLSYIMYLLEMPNRSSKKAKHSSQNKKLVEYFNDTLSDCESLKLENNSALDNLRQELKKLK